MKKLLLYAAAVAVALVVGIPAVLAQVEETTPEGGEAGGEEAVTPAATEPTPAAIDPTPAAADPTPAATNPTPAAADPTPAATDPTPAATVPADTAPADTRTDEVDPQPLSSLDANREGDGKDPSPENNKEGDDNDDAVSAQQSDNRTTNKEDNDNDDAVSAQQRDNRKNRNDDNDNDDKKDKKDRNDDKDDDDDKNDRNDGDPRQEFDQEAESGDINQSVDVINTGDNVNQCVAVLQAANTGNVQNAQGVTQDDSEADDIEAEGSGLNISPRLVQDCRQIILQVAVAQHFGGGKANSLRARALRSKAFGTNVAALRAARPALAAIRPVSSRTTSGSRVPALNRAVRSSVAGLTGTRRLPRTGGLDITAMLVLGAGGLLIGGGILVRRLGK